MILKVLVALAVIAGSFSDFHVAFAPTAHAQTQPKETQIEVQLSSTVVAVPIDPEASNCYMFVQSLIPSLPRSSELKSNTTPFVGAVVLMDFPHYAIVTKLEETGFWVKDSNWGGPGYRTHFVPWGYKHIEGFWSPTVEGPTP